MELIPFIDQEKLQAAVDAAALKATVATLDDFYNSYNSPFRKSLREELEKKGVSFGVDLPDIVGMINAAISAEVDRLANNAIAATYLPLVREMLIRVEGSIAFTTILKKLVEENSAYERSDFSCEIEEDNRYGWQTVTLGRAGQTYEFTLHKHDENNQRDMFRLLSIPRVTGKGDRKMTVFLDEGHKIEMPFTPDVLRDSFVAYLAALVLNQTVIHLDSDRFDYDWFDSCRCH